MSLGSDLLTLRNFVNSKVANNNARNITGAQLNSVFTQLMNIISGVITLASITRVNHNVVVGDVAAGKTSFVMAELIGSELFLVSSQSAIYFPIADLDTIVPGDVNLYYTFDSLTGRVTTLDFGVGYILNIYYRPA